MRDVKSRGAYRRRIAYALLCASCVFFCRPTFADYTLISLTSFQNGDDGAYPGGELALSGGILYGTTSLAGAGREGTIYSEPVTGGPHTTLASCGPPIGYNNPNGVIFSNGVLYSTALGSVISLPANGGAITTLATPGATSGLTLSGGLLYGTTNSGGTYNDGTVFSVPITGGKPTVLASFNGTDGNDPLGSSVTISGGTLYGTTGEGGTQNYGTVYSLPITGGTPTVLASFSYPNPIGGVILSDGTLFGVTGIGGADNDGTVYSLPVLGGTPDILASFDGADGKSPGALILSGDTLYGATGLGGDYNAGEIYSLATTGGTPTLLESFDGTDGSSPAALMFDGYGGFYSTTYEGGATGSGTVFQLQYSPLPSPLWAGALLMACATVVTYRQSRRRDTRIERLPLASQELCRF
jgi:uncharacterized repeat protein (TIGR03803 family)